MTGNKPEPITFFLAGEPESLNQILNNHWSVRSRRNRQIRDTVFAECWQAGWRKSWPVAKRVDVIIKNWRGDNDGAIGGCKAILDALVENDIIKDDSPKEILLTYIFKKTRDKKKGVEIKLSYDK